MNIFRRLIRIFRPDIPNSRQDPLSPQAVVMLIKKIEQTQEVEIPCDEMMDVVDQYAEKIVSKEDMAHLMPMVKQHLEICSTCREEFEALLRILEANSETQNGG